MTLLFLGLLAAAWVAVFLPALLRARTEAPLSTAERFKRRLNLLAPRARTGRWIVVPESYDRLRRASFRRGQKRRQQILLALSGAAAISFLGAVIGGGAAWEAHLAIDASLGLYIVLLLDAKRRRAERGTKVHALRRRQVPAREEVAFYEPVRATAEHNG